MWPFSEDNYQQESTPAHVAVLDFLHKLDKGNNALRAAALGKDIGEAWSQNEEHSWGDVFGIPEGKETDDWGTWLWNGGRRFGLDAGLDMWNFVPPVKLVKWLGKSEKAAELGGKLYGTGWGLRTGHRLPGEKYREIEEALYAAGRQANEPMVDFAAQAAKANEIAEPWLQGIVKDTLDSGGTMADAKLKQGDFWHSYEHALSMTPEMETVKSAIQPLHDTRDVLRGDLNTLLEHFNLGQLKNVTQEGQYLPHKLTKPGARMQADDMARRAYELGIPADPESTMSREIMKWVTDAGEQKLVTKADDPFKRIRETVDPVTGVKTYELAETGERINPVQASLREKMGPVKAERWETNPVTALYDDTQAISNKVNYLKKMKALVDSGAIQQLTEENADKLIRLPIKGFEGFGVADKAIRNRLMNLANNSFGKDLVNMPWDVKLLDKIVNSKAGQKLNELTNWWKRNTLLGSPGFHFGNAASNQALLYSGDMPFYKIPVRDLEALKLQRGFGSDIFEGMSNADFMRQMQIRNIANNPEMLWSQANADPRTAERLKKIPLMPDSVANAAQWVGNKIGDVNQFGAKVARGIEDNSTLALVIDQLKRAGFNPNTMSPEEMASLMDKAAMWAEKRMVRYAADPMAVPQYEQNLQKLIPFYNWTRGMLGNTAGHLYNNPAKLNRFGNAMDTIFMPLNDSQYAVADANIKESGPVVGMFGKSFDDMAADYGLQPLDNGTRMMQMQRLLPWGVAEQWMKRPVDALMSGINPYLKAPYELAVNRDSFKDREIDPLARGFLESLYAPLTSGMYSKEDSVAYGGLQLPAGWAKIASTMPWARHSNELQTIGRGLLWEEDPYRQEMSGLEKAMYYLTGGKAVPFDEFRAQARRKRERQEQSNAAKYGLKKAIGKGYDPAAEHYMRILELLGERPAY